MLLVFLVHLSGLFKERDVSLSDCSFVIEEGVAFMSLNDTELKCFLSRRLYFWMQYSFRKERFVRCFDSEKDLSKFVSCCWLEHLD